MQIRMLFDKKKTQNSASIYSGKSCQNSQFYSVERFIFDKQTNKSDVRMRYLNVHVEAEDYRFGVIS